MTRHTLAGFSLIEALVALSILAVSATTLLSAAQAHTRSITAVSERTIARWIAQNRIVELEFAPATAAETVQMAGAEWLVRAETSKTADADLDRIDIAVTTANAPGTILARLTGYLDAKREVLP